MWQAMDDLSISACQADALFASAVRRCDEPDSDQVRQAIEAAIRAFGSRGCAGRVAQEFGDHPETAVVRMRWARFVVGEASARTPESRRGHHPHSGWQGP